MVKLVGEDARDLHVVALGVSAGDVFHGDVGGGLGALLPVARCVGTFHADAGLVTFGRGGGVGPSLSAPTSSETEKAVNARVEHLRLIICNTGKTENGLPTLR